MRPSGDRRQGQKDEQRKDNRLKRRQNKNGTGFTADSVLLALSHFADTPCQYPTKTQPHLLTLPAPQSGASSRARGISL